MCDMASLIQARKSNDVPESQMMLTIVKTIREHVHEFQFSDFILNPHVFKFWFASEISELIFHFQTTSTPLTGSSNSSQVFQIQHSTPNFEKISLP